MTMANGGAAAAAGAEGGAAATAGAGGGAGAAKTENNNPASGVGGAANDGKAGAPAWHADATPEDLAWYGSKGWDKMDGNAAAKAMSQSYRNLEKLVGAEKAGNTVVLPGESADQATKDAFYNRLGRPATVDKYEISAKEIKGMSEDTANDFLGVTHKLGLTKAQAQGLRDWNNAKAEQIQNTLAENAKIEQAQQLQKIKDEWGAAYEKNAQIVDEAAVRLGMTEEVVLGMKEVFGVDGAMKLLLHLGEAVGEGRFVGGDTGNRGDGSGGTMTPEQAKLALDKLMKTPEFKTAIMNKQHPDHQSMMDKKAQFNKWITGTK